MLRKLKLINQLTLKIMAEGDNISAVKIATEEAVNIFKADFGFAWGEFQLKDKYEIVYTYKMPGKITFPFEKNDDSEMHLPYDSNVKQENYKTKISPSLKSYIVIPIHYFDHSYGNIVVGYKKRHIYKEEEVALARVLGSIIAQTITINWVVESERRALTLSEKQEAYYRALLENSHEIIMHLDEKGNVVYISPSVKKITGLGPLHYIDKNITEFSRENRKSGALSYIKKVLSDPHKRHMEEFEYKTKTGETLFFESTSTRMHKEEGESGIVINIRNITERKRLEMAKKAERQLQEEKIKVDAIADATHELRTPLAIIKGNIDLAEHGEKNLKSFKSILRDIDQEVKHLSNIVSDLALITSKPRGLQNLVFTEKVNVRELIRESVDRCQTLAHKKNINITAKNIEDCTIAGDKDYLEKMLTNLIKNSINYGNENGHTKVTASKSKGFVTINIEDDGIGISAEDLPRVFDRFYRGDKSHSSNVSEGTGLGLSIVKWIVENHKGSISAKSTENKGTTFSVKLPIKRPEAK